MQFTIDRSSKLSFYEQIKHQLTAALHMGSLRSGSALPTVRKLARVLHVNPKTVLKVYHLLQEEGLIEIRVGSGVRVSSAEVKKLEQTYFNSLVSLARHHLAEVQRLQFPLKNYLRLLHELVGEKKRWRGSCLVLECNTEQIRLFASEIAAHLGITAHPVFVKDLLRPTRRVASLLRKASFLITTDFHWNEVERVARRHQKTALKIRLKPEFIHSLIEAARKGGILMIVANLDYFPNFRSALRNLGYASVLPHISAALASDARRVTALLKRVKYVYVSPLCDAKVFKKIPPSVQMVRFAHHLSTESLESLRTAILIHRLQKMSPAPSAHSS